MTKLSYSIWCGSFVVCFSVATALAQMDRDQFIVVTTADLAEHPQRYWSRGVVFEDVFERDTGRTRRIGGRSFFEIETRDMGRIWVDMALNHLRDTWLSGQRAVFSGTVLNEVSRGATLRRTTTYFVALDFVEPLSRGGVTPLRMLPVEEGAPLSAAQHIRQAMLTVQSRLLAQARSEGVDMATLFEANHPHPDKGTEMARLVIRELELASGMPAGQWLTLFVRDLVAQQYVGQNPTNLAITPPAQVEEHP